MNLISSLLFAASLGVSAAFRDVRENFGSDRVVDIHVDHFNPEVGSLFEEHEADIFGVNEEGFASVKLSNDAISNLEKAGISFQDTTEDWVQHLQRNLDSICTASDGSCSENDAFYDNYQYYDTIMARVQSAVNSVSFARSLVIGRSFEGRDIIAVEVGEVQKPLVYMMCTIHAREWLTPMFCTHFIETLVANGGHPILDTFQITLVPIGNPDGYIYSTDVNSMWRKTRNTNPGSSCIGTDPNRNWGDHHCEKGTSNNPCTDIYCGPAPFSTSEVNSVNEYAKRHSSRIISWIDVHSYGGMWLSPLGYDYGEPPAADYNRMASCMSRATTAAQSSQGYRFIYGPAADVLGPAAGASDDWFYFAYDVIYSFTLELRGRGFQPSASNIKPSNAEITAGVLAQLDCINDIEIRGLEIPLPENIPQPEEAPEAEESSSSIRGGRVAGAFFSFVLIGMGVAGLAYYFRGSDEQVEEVAVQAMDKEDEGLTRKAKPSEYTSTANPMHVEE